MAALAARGPVPRKMLVAQSTEDRAKYALEVGARLDAATAALHAFIDRHPEVPPDLFKNAIAPATYEAVLSGLNFVIEEVRTMTLMQVAEQEAAARQAADAARRERRLQPQAMCGCCDPPVALAQHTHKPIRGLHEELAPPATPEDDPASVVIYRDALGRGARVRLGEDKRVTVRVSGDTWSAKDTMRHAGLRFNGKTGREAAWVGRTGEEGLLAIGMVADENIQVIILDAVTGEEIPLAQGAVL